MLFVTYSEAESKLHELFIAATKGETVIVELDNHQQVQITPRVHTTAPVQSTPREFGSARGKFVMSDDFNDLLEDFAEYM